jgi:hypothetical protein
MALERFNFNTPVGRFVSGSLTEKRTTDNNGRPIDPDKQRYEFGLAIRADDPGVGPLIQAIAMNARNQYAVVAAHVVPKIDQWMQTLDGFSMKISNGNEPNSKGVVNKNTVGCYVFWFSTAMPIVTCRVPDNAQIPADAIKRGWYVDVAGSSVINGLTDHQAGAYLNPSVVRLCFEGEEIIGGIDPNTAFANSPPPMQMPAGARPIGALPSVPASAGPPSVGMMHMPAPAPVAPPMGLPAPQPAPVGGMPAPAGMQPYPGAAQPGNGIASPSNAPPPYFNPMMTPGR